MICCDMKSDNFEVMEINTVNTTVTKRHARVDVADVLRGFRRACNHPAPLYRAFQFLLVSRHRGPERMAHIRRPLNMGRPVFTFGGKAYAIFALLFGFSFYPARQPAYARLRLPAEILLATGSSAADWSAQCRILYRREVLVMYALVGFVLVATCRLSDRWIITLSAICMLQPVCLWQIMRAISDPEYTITAIKHIGLLGRDIRRTKQCRIPRDCKGQPVGGPAGVARMGMGPRTNIPDCRTFRGRHAHRPTRMVWPRVPAVMAPGLLP